MEALRSEKMIADDKTHTSGMQFHSSSSFREFSTNFPGILFLRIFAPAAHSRLGVSRDGGSAVGDLEAVVEVGAGVEDRYA